jgi:uncharacterized protein YqeY
VSAPSESALRQDLQAAMKARQMPTVYVLRGLLAAIANGKIEKRVAELPEAEILALIQREAKKREEAEAFARTADRTDLVEQNVAERAILERYLPRSLDDAELTDVLRGWIATGIQEIGPLMARLKQAYPGRYDGKRASEIVRGLLAG